MTGETALTYSGRYVVSLFKVELQLQHFLKIFHYQCLSFLPQCSCSYTLSKTCSFYMLHVFNTDDFYQLHSDVKIRGRYNTHCDYLETSSPVPVDVLLEGFELSLSVSLSSTILMLCLCLKVVSSFPFSVNCSDNIFIRPVICPEK